MDPTDGNSDQDGDLLTLGQEWVLGTSWTNSDHDGGGEIDGIEVLIAGTDPIDPSDDVGAENDENEGQEPSSGPDTSAPPSSDPSESPDDGQETDEESSSDQPDENSPATPPPGGDSDQASPSAPQDTPSQSIQISMEIQSGSVETDVSHSYDEGEQYWVVFGPGGEATYYDFETGELVENPVEPELIGLKTWLTINDGPNNSRTERGSGFDGAAAAYGDLLFPPSLIFERLGRTILATLISLLFSLVLWPRTQFPMARIFQPSFPAEISQTLPIVGRGSNIRIKGYLTLGMTVPLQKEQLK